MGTSEKPAPTELGGLSAGSGGLDAEAFVRTLFQTTKDFVWAVEPERFELLVFNRSMAEYFRTERGVVLAPGLGPDALFPTKESADDWRELYGRALRDGAYETHYRTAPGPRVLHLRVSPIENGGRVAGVVAFGRDVTEQRRAEEEVERSEARFRRFVEEMPAAFGVARDGRIVYVNHALRSLLRFPEGLDARGRSIGELVAPESRELVHSHNLARAAGEAAPGEYDVVGLRFDGSRFPVQLSARLVELSDGPATIAIFVDLTARRQAEEHVLQSQKLESVGRLAGGVAHDFNNVLTVILSCGEALKRALSRGRPVDPDEVAQICSAAERARDLTRQLLAVARRQVIAPEALDLAAVVRDAQGMIARLLGEDVALTFALAPAPWPAWADRAQIDQILLNLAANARDALPRGGNVRVAISNLALAEPTPDWPGLAPGAYVLLGFRDDGVGMDAEVRERLFEPFFTTKAPGKGTGLGLATVHGIVAQAGGQIRVESAPGQGSAFEIALPRSPEAAVAPAPPPAPEPAPGGSETILLVEDDPAVRRQGLRALSGAGYQVHVAGDGVEALEVVGTLPAPPDLVISDVIMPRMDGARLAAELRRRWPGLRVLFTSGYAGDRLDSMGVPGGGPDFLEKPFSASSLLRRVRASLDRKGWG